MVQIVELTDVQETLQAIARNVLAQRSAPSNVRVQAEEAHGYDRALWAEAGQLGWLGLDVPEALGGSGQSFLEVALVLKELGRATTPGPYLSQSLAVAALLARADHELAGAWLPRLVTGECIGAVALGTLDLVGAARRDVVARGARHDAVVLSGRAPLVADAASADVLVVVAQADGDPLVVLVPEPGGQCSMTWRPTTDQTRRLYDVELDAVEVPASSVLARGDAATALIDELWRRAAVGVALDGVGGSAKALEMTVDHTSTRVQYGRPIATFQAVKHTCADMLVACETARVATDAAVLALVSGAPDAAYWAAVAKFRSGDAYATVAGDALQMHGGIGMTWEFDLHLWLKRAKLNQALYGHSAVHRAIVTRLAAM